MQTFDEFGPRADKARARSRNSAVPTGTEKGKAGGAPPTAAIRMKLSGADGSAAMTWTDKLASVSNYYIVNNPAKWRTNVPHYQRVQARDVYPGIDLQYYGNEGRQEHDFLVAAGADPARIRLQLSGADKTLLTAAGDLSLGTSLAT